MNKDFDLQLNPHGFCFLMDSDWISSFLLNQIWIGFKNFVLKFVTAFDSVSGLQIIVFNLLTLVQWSFSCLSELCIV